MSRAVDNVLIKFLKFHDNLYKKTHGWVGHRLPGIPPSLMLHSVGAKSGAARTNTLTYARDGDSYLVTASNGGAPKNPAWLHNVRAHPNLQINVGRHRFPVTAHIIGPDDADYARLWHIVNANNADRYTDYQSRTTRPIAVVKLTP